MPAALVPPTVLSPFRSSRAQPGPLASVRRLGITQETLCAGVLSDPSPVSALPEVNPPRKCVAIFLSSESTQSLPNLKPINPFPKFRERLWDTPSPPHPSATRLEFTSLQPSTTALGHSPLSRGLRVSAQSFKDPFQPLPSSSSSGCWPSPPCSPRVTARPAPALQPGGFPRAESETVLLTIA